MPRIGGSGGAGASSGASTVVVLNYNEITSIAVGIETVIVTYTAPSSSTKAYLQLIGSSGTNKAEYRIYKDASVIDKRYTYYTEYNVDFDYRTCDSSSPGLLIPAASMILIKVVNNSIGLANFNGKIQILEVG